MTTTSLKRYRTLAVGGVVIGLLAACAATDAEDGGADTYTLTIANVFSAETPSGRTLIEFEKSIEEASEGRIQVNLHQGGTLGGELETIEQMQSGSINGMVSQSVVILQGQIPELAVEELPFMFPSQEVAYEAVDGDYGAAVTERVRTVGIETLAYWENGFRHFTNNKHAIAQPSEMSGLKFRSAESAIRLEMFDALGASAIPMPFTEVYTGLEQGTVDGQENPLATIWNSGFVEVQDYLSLSGHIWNAAPFWVSTAWWDTLPADLQELMSKEVMDHRLVNRKMNQEEEASILQKMKDAGMTVTEVDTEAFREATAPVWQSWEDKIGPDFMKYAQEIRDAG